MTDMKPFFDVLSVPLKCGADFSELYMEDREEFSLRHDGSQVYSASSSRQKGVGLYLLSGAKSRYGYTCDCSLEGVKTLAKNLSSMITWEGGSAPAALPPLREEHYTSANVVRIDPKTVSEARKKAVLKKVCDMARAYSPKIVEAHGEYQDYVQNVTILNSLGLLTGERRVITTLRLFVTASDGSKSMMNWGNFSSALGFEFVENEEKLASIVDTVCEGALNGLVARKVEPQFLPIVVDSGTFIHEACGHSLEATHVAGGNSVFYGKVGQKVASEKVTILDSGIVPGMCGSFAISDEGVPSSPALLIEKGILRGYMADRKGARALGVPMTANGRRQNYRFAPGARMTNTYMQTGSDPTESIIPSVEKGIYVKEVGGGNVNPVTGNFNFLIASGFMIEHGEVTYPIASVNLSGQSIETLCRVSMVGDKYFPDDGSLCGAESGLVYVTSYQPRILIDGMMIG